ncbi:MAG: tetratricopeptide repeat protein [Chloroflexi bacterium]|nr:tetratricopeptide repeat protein [Chloroflexota bacterium]
MAAYPLIHTKIKTPRRRQNLLHRERLVDFLHDNIHNKLILIAAGAGYGKTSLLIDYAHDTDLPVCWYSLDANDAHPLTFLEYLVASIRSRFPNFGEPILQALREHTGPVEAVEPFVRLLIHEIEEQVQQYFVIILDDYHEVIENESVNALIDGLLRYLPEHCHIVLASRGIPRRLTLTRLAARQEVVGLGVEHLRFTPDEIQTLLGSLGRTDLPPAQMQTLAERTEGWITGVLLAAQTNWPGASRDILQISGATGGVFDYMAEEILSRQSPEKQRFLLGSALFHEMSPQLCDALLKINNSAELLRELAQENLFTFPMDAEGVWYQYHQLFREFLVAKLQRDDFQQYRQLCVVQAGILADRGRQDKAIESYLAAGAFDQAANTLEIVAQDTFDTGQWDQLRRWIDALPDAERNRHPRLLLFRGKISTETGELDQATTLLESCHRAYMAQQDPIGAARALIQTAVVQRFRGRPTEAINACQKALQMAADQDALVATQAHHNIGICYVMLGQIPEGIEELITTLQLAEAHGDQINAAFTAHDLGTAEWWRGHLVTARQYYHQALMYWRKIGNSSALASTLAGLGVVHHQLGQYQEAESRLQEGLSKAENAADVRIQVHCWASQGDLFRDTGRYQEALDCYAKAFELAANAQLTQLMLYALNAAGDTHRLKGDLTQARQVLVEAMDQIHAQNLEYETGLNELALGVLAFQEGQRTEAQTRLTHARQLFIQNDAKRDLARTHLHLALIAQTDGDESAVREHLGTVAELAGELGSQQFLVGEGPMMEPLLRYAEQSGLNGLDYRRLRAELGHTASAAPAPAIRAVSAPLQFLGLNGGQVLLDGQAVTEWETTSARIMAFLFASYPEGLPRERVIEMLWPEVSSAKGNSLFHSTMYRVRSALSKTVIIHDKGNYRLNPDYAYRFDVFEFQQFARLGQGNDEAAHLARVQAIDLYQTPFLEICENDWCIQLRSLLHNTMLNLLLAEARHLAQAGCQAQAEQIYQRALSFDSFDEHAHRGIMWCRASNSDRAGAIQQFLECKRILEDELQIPPSPETLALQKAIQSGQAISPPT